MLAGISGYNPANNVPPFHSKRNIRRNARVVIKSVGEGEVVVNFKLVVMQRRRTFSEINFDIAGMYGDRPKQAVRVRVYAGVIVVNLVSIRS
jgi:hypothetical protein